MTTEEECYQSDCTDESFSYYKPEYVEFSDDSNNSVKQRYLLAEYKKGEKGYHIIKRIGKGGEQTFFEFYETAIFPRTTIRNAVTGERYKGRYVGSSDENLFFKVINSSAELKNKDPFVLFYENPEQWERHNNDQKCPTSIKSRWDAKFKEEMKKRKKPGFVSTEKTNNVI